jgi:hypothetical protein
MICTARQIPYVELIERIVQSAARRVRPAGASAAEPACEACETQACE